MSSIVDDIKHQYHAGGHITRLIMINLAVFAAVIVLGIFARFAASDWAGQSLVVRQLAISGDFIDVLMRPWSLITHMFLHVGIWHILWNMLLLYWFGRRVEDLIGQKHTYSLYVYGGLASAMILLMSVALFGYLSNPAATPAYGASGAVMAFVVAAATLNPESEMRLILFGSVKLKYIAAAIILLDIVSLSGYNNTGGHFGHLGGAAMGWLYIYALRTGWDLRPTFLINLIEGKPQRRHRQPVHVSTSRRDEAKHVHISDGSPVEAYDEIDRILDKIAAKGIDSLSVEERDTLDQASRS